MEAVLQPASVQVQAIKVVLLLLETLWNASVFRGGRPGKRCLPFPLQAAHSGYHPCRGQSPCAQVPAAQNGQAGAHQLGGDPDRARGSALQHSNAGCDGGGNGRVL